MRKSGIITLLVLVALFFGIGYFLTSSLFEGIIEDAATEMVGAKVEIDGFEFSFIGPEVSWQRLQVTNPKKTMTNMLETGECSFDMEFWPLIQGHFVIEDFSLTGLARNTDRETDGKIEKPIKKKKSTEADSSSSSEESIAKTQKKLEKEKEQIPAFEMANSLSSFNTDSVIALLDLRTPGLIDSSKTVLEESYKKWEEKLAETDPQEDVDKIKAEIASIDIKKVKDLKSFNAALKSVKTVQSSIDDLNKEYKQTRKDFNADYDNDRSSLSNVDNWIKDDYARAMNMAKLPDFSAQNIGKMLFGDKIVDEIYEYLGYVGTAREYMHKIKGNEKDPDPPRYKGQDIHFSSKWARPKFWLKNMEISGNLTEELPLGGTITNVSNNPTMIGQPLKMDIAGSSNSRSYAFNGELNYLEEEPKELFTANYYGVAIDGMKLASSNLLPNSIKEGTGNVDITFNIVGDNFDGNIIFNASKVSYDYGDSKASGKLAQIIRDVFSKTTDLKIETLIKGRSDDLVFAVKSNLDDALSNAFKSVASREVEAAKKKIRKKIDDEVASKKAEVEKLIAENKKKLQDQLDKFQEKIEEQKNVLEEKKKEIEKQKDKFGDKVKDKIKDLFK